MLSALTLIQGLALALLLLRLFPGRRRRPAVEPRPDASSLDGDVSVVVATLDEAHRVRLCLDGLAAQGSVVREILVVDSGSADGTADLVRDAATRDPRITLRRDPPLPAGWVGKVWALQHGLEHARGEWVLGMDADTRPHPGCVGGALAAARALGYDAVSFAPRFSIESAGERWLQPALLVTLVYRFGATGTDVDPERVMANGQCFLARREVLLAAGGYSSARSSFSDDVTLARTLARAGRRVGFLDGARLYDVRAYTSAREAWREWGRSLDLKDATSRVRQWSDVLFLLVVQGTPLLVLAGAAIGALAGRSRSPVVVAAVATSAALLAVRVMLQWALASSYERKGVPFWLSPLADPLAAIRILLSTLRTPKRWRSREYGLLTPPDGSLLG
ncbi:MAG TPA: glycosyltransferase family 2 protein [Gemmatimonadaceae bacterium]|nr:glycosyltransferase family 2 protein [Gemmatimonadaceae bacterium]